MALFLITCLYICICKSTGYMIFHLEDYVAYYVGHNLYTFYFFSLIFYILVGIYSYIYYDRIYLFICANEIKATPLVAGKYADYINHIECWNHDEIMTSVRNLFHEYSANDCCTVCSNFQAIMNVFSEPD